MRKTGKLLHEKPLAAIFAASLLGGTMGLMQVASATAQTTTSAAHGANYLAATAVDSFTSESSALAGVVAAANGVQTDSMTGTAVSAGYTSAAKSGNKAATTADDTSPIVTPLFGVALVNTPLELTPEATAAPGQSIDLSLTCVIADLEATECNQSVSLGDSGTLAYDPVLEKIVFTPATDYVGLANGFYVMTDDSGASGTAPVSVSVVSGTTAGDMALTVAAGGTASGQPSVVVPDARTITNTCVKVAVDSETCGATATVSGGEFGYNSETNTISFTSDGSAPAEPVVGYYQVTDSADDTSTAQISVTVIANPTVEPVTVTGGAGASLTSPLTGSAATGSFIDPTKTCLQETAEGTCGATVSVELGEFAVANGVMTFTPATATTSGTATAFYRVENNLGGKSAPGEITVTLIAKPTANAIAAATTQGTTEVLLAPDATAAEGATLDDSKTCLRETAEGDCTTELTTAAGTFRFIAEGNKIGFNPAADFSGEATAFYRVEDNFGSTATASVAVSVAAVTPQPIEAVVIVPGTKAAVADIAALAGPGYNVASVEVSVDNGATWHTPEVSDAPKGDWSVDAGVVSFTADAAYTGEAKALARIQGSDPVTPPASVEAAATVNEFLVYDLSVTVEAEPGVPGQPTDVVVTGVVPEAPTGVIAVAGDREATVRWTAPVSDNPGQAQAEVSWAAPADPGATPIVKYIVTASPGDITCETSSGEQTFCLFTNLTHDTAYTFTVVALNDDGPSEASAESGSYAPSRTTEYTVTSFPDANGCSTIDSLTCVVEGLENGTTYTFVVVATNDIGSSPESEASNSVTPSNDPNPNPTPTPTPTPNPNPNPGPLPVTGSNMLAPIGLGLLFVLAGIATIGFTMRDRILARMRRMH